MERWPYGLYWSPTFNSEQHKIIPNVGFHWVSWSHAKLRVVSHCLILDGHLMLPAPPCSTWRRLFLGLMGRGEQGAAKMCLCTHCTVPTLVSPAGAFTPTPPPPGESQSQRCSAYACSFKRLSNLSSTTGLHFYHTHTPRPASPPRLLPSVVGAFSPPRWILLGSFFCSYKNVSKPFRFKVNSESSKFIQEICMKTWATVSSVTVLTKQLP